MVQKGGRPPATLPREARLSYCDANPAPPSPAMTDYSLDINIPTMAVRHEGQPSWQPWYPPAGPPSVPPASLQGAPLLSARILPGLTPPCLSGRIWGCAEGLGPVTPRLLSWSSSFPTPAAPCLSVLALLATTEQPF